MKKAFPSVTTLLFLCGFVFSQAENPKGDYNLFRINRSRGPASVFYDVYLNSNGQPDRTEPLKIYWIGWNGNPEAQPITAVQKKLGYGVKIMQYGENEVTFSIAALPGQQLVLKKDIRSGDYRVLTKIGDEQVNIDSLYIDFSNNSFWSPKVSGVNLYGKSPGRGNVTTRIAKGEPGLSNQKK